MRMRFFGIIKEMSHDALTRFCNLDHDREIAIVAQLQEENKRIIGTVTLILEPDGKTGEFAILVCDQWQSLGLGSQFMDVLADIAKDRPLEEIHSYVISDNSKMVNLCKQKGFRIEVVDEETIKVSLPMVH